MNEWPGVRRDLADAVLDTGEGMQYAQNARFYLDGEIALRSGLSAGTSTSGTAIAQAWDPMTGYQILLFTSTGSIVAVTL